MGKRARIAELAEREAVILSNLAQLQTEISEMEAELRVPSKKRSKSREVVQKRVGVQSAAQLELKEAYSQENFVNGKRRLVTGIRESTLARLYRESGFTYKKRRKLLRWAMKAPRDCQGGMPGASMGYRVPQGTFTMYRWVHPHQPEVDKFINLLFQWLHDQGLIDDRCLAEDEVMVRLGKSAWSNGWVGKGEGGWHVDWHDDSEVCEVAIPLVGGGARLRVALTQDACDAVHAESGRRIRMKDIEKTAERLQIKGLSLGDDVSSPPYGPTCKFGGMCGYFSSFPHTIVHEPGEDGGARASLVLYRDTRAKNANKEGRKLVVCHNHTAGCKLHRRP